MLALIFSLCFTFLAIIKNGLLRNISIKILFIFLPILITIIVLSIQSNGYYDLTTLKGFAYFKLIGDRKPIWDASLEQIKNSSLFFGEAGNNLTVFFDFNNTIVTWSAGAHNIFLEIGRQLGAINMFFLSFIIIYFLFKTSKNIYNIKEQILFYGFISVYLSIGLTGQSIIYDGVGTFYWIMFTHFYLISNLNIGK
jgi:O-antigen ligase